MEQILSATEDDYRIVYGDDPSYSMRLFKVVEGNDVLALFGVYYCQRTAIAFCRIQGDFPAKRIWRVTKRCFEKLKALNIPLLAIAGNSCTAPNFLKHLGFEHIDTRKDGAIYQWAPQQYH